MKVEYTIKVKVEVLTEYYLDDDDENETVDNLTDAVLMERLVEQLKDNPYCITEIIDNANRKDITATVVLVS